MAKAPANGVGVISFRFSGRAPLLMHNALPHFDPDSPLFQRAKRLKDKKGNNRTEADNLELAELDLRMGAYVDDDGRFTIPLTNIEACLVGGASKAARKGKEFKAAVFASSCKLIAEGPMDLEERLKQRGDRRYVDMAVVVVGKQKIPRYRFRFYPWTIECDVQFDTSVVSRADVEEAANIAGQRIGIGDWRPRNGRFASEVL